MDIEQKVEQFQTEYLEALKVGNADEQKRLEKEIDSLLNNQPTSPPTPEAPETTAVEDTQVEVSGEAQAEPALATEGDPAPQFDEDTQKWLDGLDKSIRPHIEAKLNEDKKNLLLDMFKMQQRIKADEGRVAAYQRRYEDVVKKAVQQEELLKKYSSSTAQPQGNPAATQSKTATSIDDDPDLKQIAETDEQLARTILKREQLLRAELDQMKAMFQTELAPMRKNQEDVRIQSELGRLQQMVPNAVEIFNYRDPSGVNVWEDWVARQPRGVQTLATSDNADDVVRALELYGRDIERIYGNQTQEKPADRAEAKPDPKAAAVAQERARKLQAQPVGSASVKPPQKTEPTLEEIAANPELLEKYQQKILEEERKKRGLA